MTQPTWTVLGDDAVVAQQEDVLQVHGPPREAQEQVLAGVGPQQGYLEGKGERVCFWRGHVRSGILFT